MTADGLTQLQTQCSDQIGTVAAGLSDMHDQLAGQLPTAIAGVAQAADGNVQAAGLVSTDRRTTLFAISMSEDADEAASHILELREYVLTGDGIGVGPDTFDDGFRVRMVGSSNVSRDMQDVALSDLMKSMMVAVPIVLVVLFVVFGTLGAAMLPIVLSLVSIVVALGVAAVVGIWMPLNFAIENIVAMLGLALGVDHALFVAYRYSEERQKGLRQDRGHRQVRGHGRPRHLLRRPDSRGGAPGHLHGPLQHAQEPGHGGHHRGGRHRAGLDHPAPGHPEPDRQRFRFRPPALAETASPTSRNRARARSAASGTG